MPKYEEMKQLKERYQVIPLCKEIFADIVTPIMILRKIASSSKKYFLLESVTGGEKWGRYSFLGFNPLLRVTCKNHHVVISGKENRSFDTEKPMEVLREIINQYKAPTFEQLPPFSGGFMGYFAYEMIGYAEPKLHFKERESNDFDLMLFDKVIAYDHLKQKISVIANVATEEFEVNYHKAISEIDEIIQLIKSPLLEEEAFHEEEVIFQGNVSKEEYCQLVIKTKEYILQGDIFQGVISRRMTARYSNSLLNAYRVLRTSNPSPYMVFLNVDDLQLITSSPETLIRLNQGKLTTFPIAGSRPRGKNKEEDIGLEKELLADEKECAEHNMLVDLARNDVGKLSKFQSVKVNDYMHIQKFSTIMHITSEVEGNLKEGKDALDAIEAILPAGTLSGAPKIRACEIIEELEPESRGLYGGAIGYIDFTGNMDTCIAIRMAVKEKDQVYVQAGAGIVFDSVPETEFHETEHKARAVIEALKAAKEVR